MSVLKKAGPEEAGMCPASDLASVTKTDGTNGSVTKSASAKYETVSFRGHDDFFSLRPVDRHLLK